MRSSKLLCVFLLCSVWCWTGCQSPTQPGSAIELIQSSKVSDCGGFELKRDSVPLEYCDAEVLRWRYTDDAGTLTLSNERVLLNCCGEHAVEAERVDGVYVVTETDDPGKAGRCLCMCVFDFAITVEGVARGITPLRLVRNVTDAPAKSSIVFEGALDLGDGTGIIIIDTTDVGPWCESPQP